MQSPTEYSCNEKNFQIGRRFEFQLTIAIIQPCNGVCNTLSELRSKKDSKEKGEDPIRTLIMALTRSGFQDRAERRMARKLIHAWMCVCRHLHVLEYDARSKLC